MLIDLKTAGRQIRHTRQQQGISQAELARLAEVSRATIVGLENGTINEIGVNRLNRIVAASRITKRPVAAPAPSRRKSEDLQLSFPYDWSNPDMSDSVLIGKVVERGLFEDMVKIAVRFGIAPLRRAVTAFIARNRAAAPGLTRMLANIEKALHA
jgi:transcriptional regulator with XRE-family HTH domain